MGMCQRERMVRALAFHSGLTGRRRTLQGSHGLRSMVNSSLWLAFYDEFECPISPGTTVHSLRQGMGGV